MDDPVLHRKMFRHTALRSGALKPRSYKIGAPEFGVGSIYFTGEAQGTPDERVFYKDGRRFTVDKFGNVIKTEYMPSQYKGSGTTAKIAEAIFDPLKAYREGTYGQLGRQALEGVKAIPGAVKKGLGYAARGVKGVGKLGAGLGTGVIGYTGAEKIAEAAGGETAKGAIGTFGLGSFAAEMAGKGLERFAPNLAARLPNVMGITRAVGAPFRYLANPAVAAPLFVVGKTVEETVKARKGVLEAREKYGTEDMVPTMVGAAPRQYVQELQSQLPDISGEAAIPSGIMGVDTPISGSDLQTKGEIPSGKATPPVGADVIPAGGAQPPKKPGKGIGADINADKTFEQNLIDNASVKTDLGGKKDIGKEGSIDKKIAGESIFDRLGNFARTTSGNMFMLKFAAGLLSGKGNFGEVVGNALNPAVDLLAAYKLKEDENAYKQLKLLMDSKDKEEFLPGTLRIIDPETGATRAIPAQQDKKSLRTYKINPDGSKTELSSEVATGFRPYQASKASDIIDAFDSYGNVATARALTQYVQSVGPQALGSSGFVKNLLDRIVGSGKGYFDSFKKLENKPFQFTDANGNLLKGNDLKSAEREWNNINQGIKKIYETDTSTRQTLQNLKITETTLRYFLANAFKQKDRLTNVDLTLINDLVQVMGGTLSADQVQSKMAALTQILDEKMNTYRENVRDLGIDDAQFAMRFYQTPGAKITFGLIAPDKPVTDFNTMSGTQIDEFLKSKGFQ